MANNLVMGNSAWTGGGGIADALVDVGADELFPHLQVTGVTAPGGSFDVKLSGRPGRRARLGWSRGLLTPPAPIPGPTGLLRLDPERLAVVPAGALPKSGVIWLPITLPAALPKGVIPAQALIDTFLSDLNVIVVR